MQGQIEFRNIFFRYGNRSVIDNTVAGFAAFPGALTVDCAFATSGAAGVTCANTGTGMRMPDVVVQFRVDQAWGYAAIAGAIHDVAGAYYGTPNNVINGHPADRKGWAINAGALFNLPGGDKIGFGAQYSEGTAGYGSAILATTGYYDNPKGNVVAVAWNGGAQTVLAKGATQPSWNN